MKFRLIRLIKYALIPFGIISACFRPRKSPFVILMYHRVNDGVRKELSVTRADFRRQMDYLQKKGYRVVSLGEALSPACREKKDKKPWVVLTFDDGYEDFYTDAFPVLSEYGYTSLLYLVPGRIGSGEVFWWDRDIGESALMSWEQLDNLKKSGLVEFGSHSMSHPDFDRINRDAARQELLQSKKVLEGRLSMPVRHFAYPRGIIAHQDIVGELYETAVSIFDGSSGAAHCPLDSVTRLVRMPVQRSDGPVLFAARLKGWLCAEGFIKGLIGKH